MVAVLVSAPKGPDDIGQHADQRPSPHNSRGIRGRGDSAPCLVQATIGTPRPQRHGSCPQRTTPLRQRRGPMQATAPVAAARATHSTSARTAAPHMPPRCYSNAALLKLAPPFEANPSEQGIPAGACQPRLRRRVALRQSSLIESQSCGSLLCLSKADFGSLRVLCSDFDHHSVLVGVVVQVGERHWSPVLPNGLSAVLASSRIILGGKSSSSSWGSGSGPTGPPFPRPLVCCGDEGALPFHLLRQSEGKPCASEQHCPVLRRGQAAG